MPAKATKLGPGTLTIGAVGSPFDFAGQCTKASVEWKVDADDSVPVLSGETIAGDRTYTAQLKATVYQDDLTAAGMIGWTWSHKGQQLPFTFQPFTGDRVVTGIVTIDPLDIGGDIGKKNTSDLAWDCVGEPVLDDDLT